MIKNTFIDLFSGIGGFRLGLEKVGFKCLFSSEIDKHCKIAYKENFGETPVGDITQIPLTDIPDHEILAGGFPCQSFSICGKRKGFADKRGNLFFRICEIIEFKKPKVVFLENVKYLIYHNGGTTLNLMLSLLNDLGYHVSFKILNSLHFGVPQNRERIVIVGSKTNKFNFNILNYNLNFNIKLIDFLDKKGEFEYLKKQEYTLIKNPIQKKDSGLFFVGYRNKGMWKKGIRPNTEHLSRVHRQPNRIYSALGIHPTIPSQEPSGRFFIYIPQEKKVRKLTIRECYRIMGFPDSFKIYKKKQEAYKQIGNSICVPMVYSVAKQIKSQKLLKEGVYEKPQTIIRGSIQQSFHL